jgi:dCTP deaminase
VPPRLRYSTTVHRWTRSVEATRKWPKRLDWGRSGRYDGCGTGGFRPVDRRSPLAPREAMIKSDRWIRRMALEKGMIEPFEERQVRQGAISYGLSSYGYDLRIADTFKIFTNVYNTVVDPKDFDPRSFVDVKSDVCIIPPNSFALGKSVEYFRIPRNVITVTLGKSTYARCGIITNVTPFEPEWEGFVTLEVSNTTPLPAKIYANEGIAQVLFFEADETCAVSYRDRQGKYQAQQGIVLPKV